MVISVAFFLSLSYVFFEVLHMPEFMLRFLFSLSLLHRQHSQVSDANYCDAKTYVFILYQPQDRYCEDHHLLIVFKVKLID